MIDNEKINEMLDQREEKREEKKENTMTILEIATLMRKTLKGLKGKTIDNYQIRCNNQQQANNTITICLGERISNNEWWQIAGEPMFDEIERIFADILASNPNLLIKVENKGNIDGINGASCYVRFNLIENARETKNNKKEMEKPTNNYVDDWKKYLKDFYEEKALEWQYKTDDRRLFSNIYFQIVNALNELEKIEPINSAYIKVAINNSIRNDEKTLNDILAVFVK